MGARGGAGQGGVPRAEFEWEKAGGSPPGQGWYPQDTTGYPSGPGWYPLPRAYPQVPRGIPQVPGGTLEGTGLPWGIGVAMVRGLWWP